MILKKKLETILFLGILSLACAQEKGVESAEPVFYPPDTPVAENEAIVWYLGHCGFAVKTENHFLIFDYEETHDESRLGRPANPQLGNGYINPNEIRDFNVSIFVTHSHMDHYDPVIFEWEGLIDNIGYFFGWKDVQTEKYNHMEGPRAELKTDGLEIYTINSHHSGVPEVAYLIKVDGLVLYHNGDCQAEYQEDYEFLKTKAENIDIAFVFCVYDPGLHYTIQNYELIEKFGPNALFPMHRIGEERTHLEEFKRVYNSAGFENPVIFCDRKGKSFFYKNGRIQ
ncbi:MBL fold metallo-hydrolase [candidate division KSB1 bacterium]